MPRASRSLEEATRALSAAERWREAARMARRWAASDPGRAAAAAAVAGLCAHRQGDDGVAALEFALNHGVASRDVLQALASVALGAPDRKAYAIARAARWSSPPPPG